jgi:hypothetical protein
MLRPLLFVVFLMSSLYANGQCENIIYVSPSYYSGGGNLQAALNAVGPGGTVRLMDDNYFIYTTINIPSDVTLEGGWHATGYPNYDTLKTSEYGATTIGRSNTNWLTYENHRHFIAIRADNASNFRIQDLKITTFDGNGFFPSNSKYGIYLNGCSNYSIVRCGIEPGDGGNGYVVASGANGVAGGGGMTGGGNVPGIYTSGGGQNTLCNSADIWGYGGNGGQADGMPVPGAFSFLTFSNDLGWGSTRWGFGGYYGHGATIYGVGGNGGGGGHAGGPSSCVQWDDWVGGQAGGTGGVTSDNLNSPNGGTGMPALRNITGTIINSPGFDPCGALAPAPDGGNGAPGVPGSPGSNGQPYSLNAYFIPAGTGQAGTDGAGGQGGGGGGGGGCMLTCFPNDEFNIPSVSCTDTKFANITGGGGGGGAGGSGGKGGTGGTGGGASIGIYLINNGVNGNIIDCFVNPGEVGEAGAPGMGGSGGSGGLGGPGGVDDCNGDAGGGDGGNGGNGGNGGIGGSSHDGLSQALVLVGGAALTQMDISFPLANQSIITVQASGCAFSSSVVLSESPADWDFTVNTDAVPQTDNASGLNSEVVYATLGRKTISTSLSPDGYTDFIDINCFNTYYTVPDPYTVCSWFEGPSGKYFTELGTHTDTIPNAAGCDSIITFELEVLAETPPHLYITACDEWENANGDIYTFSTGTEYWVTHPSGCLVLQTAFITITNGAPTTSVIDTTACIAYEAPDGQYYNSGGTYTATIPNSEGCDSIITINLEIGNNESTYDDVVAAGSYTSPFGDTFTSSQLIEYQLTSTSGCDSIIQINLTVVTPPPVNTVFSCEPYISVMGNVYDASGIYSDTVYYGQDYVLITTDFTLGTTETMLAVDHCGPYTVPSGNQTYYSSGIYQDVLQSVSGCDSILVIEVTNSTTYSNFLVVVLDGTYTVPSGDETYSVDGVYSDTIPNFLGCDSIMQIHVDIETTITGLEEFNDAEIKLFPNPTQGNFTLTVTEALLNQKFKLLSVDGKVLRQEVIMGLNQNIDITNLSAGLYFVLFDELDISLRLVKE